MHDPGAVYDRLLARFGPQHWWPAETPFEVVGGALLMAQTSWANVEQALGNLKRTGVLNPRALAAISIHRLRSLVRPAGLHRTKPRRLRAFCQHLVRVAEGDLGRFFARDLEAVREELLALDGIGPETADSILLYAGGFPTFVVDAYTVRIGTRIGWFNSPAYPAVKAYFESQVPPDLARYREFHALLVAHGKHLCRPRPRCWECPLEGGCSHARDRRDKNRDSGIKERTKKP
ncbi:MAG TPA: endonuclease III domain-containing protein [Thermoplasmata archaeon]|nr:endonuclease III domain-containing protein [Thermoplasmata archaeon]